MGLLEKLKNTFFEEEYVEVEEDIKPEKKVAKKVEERVEPKKVIEKEEVKEEIEDDFLEDEEIVEEKEVDTYSDRDLVNSNSKLTYYDLEDFEPTQTIPAVKDEPTRVYGESVDVVYNSFKVDDIKDYNATSHRAYGATAENKFEPTPIISPIYGILDKNYRKEEVIDKKDRPSSYVSRKNVDLDSVRRKAYGVEKEEEKKEEIKQEEPIIIDTTDYSKPIVDQVTVGDAEEYFNDLGLEYNIDYKDRHYENATGRRSDIYNDDEVVIDDNGTNYENSEDDSISVDDLVKSTNESIDSEEAHLEDNLFDLVDSLYEDGE